MELHLKYTTINDNIIIIDLALKIEDYLIISDLHLGYEESLNKEGIMIPKFQYKKILKRISEIQIESECSKIIINGDLKHEFGKISKQEWQEVNEFLDYLSDEFLEVILIKGNHDNFTNIISEKKNLELCDSYLINNNILCLHGHKLVELSNDIEYLIIGHEHPCIGLRSGERVEKIKTFVCGDYEDKKLIIMPSFNFITEGSDILHEKLLSPYLQKRNIAEFEVYGVENFEIFFFGKISNIIKVNKKIL